MKLFHIAQAVNDRFDTYDSAVVAAPDFDAARNMNPADGKPMNWIEDADYWSTDWALKPEHVACRYLGEAESHILQGVICASFNAG